MRMKPKMRNIKKLEELALTAVYRSVVSELLRVPDHRKRNSHYISSSNSSSSVSSKDDQLICQLLRYRLKCQLNGNFNKKIREKLLKYHSQSKESNDLRPSIYLDVILDDSFDEITTWLEDTDGYFDEQLLPTIVRRCPSVNTLNIYCATPDDKHLPISLSGHLNQLQFLHSINLWKLPIQCKCVIFLLGKCCPVLKTMKIELLNGNLSSKECIQVFYADPFLNLDRAARLITKKDNQFKAFHRCQVSFQSLYPFCQTLEQVKISRIDSDDPYILAFILRHVPNLKELETSDYEFKDYSASIRALWDIWDCSGQPNMIRLLDPNPLIPDGFTSSSLFESQPHLILQSYFTGTLSLKDLFLEGELDSRTWKAVCDLCPKLNKLMLLETGIHHEDPKLETFTEIDVVNYFGKLKELRVLISTDSDGPLSINITKVTAPYLTTLELELDGDFVPKFDFLTDCINLKILKLSPEFHPPLKTYFTTSVNRESFLPNLEQVQLEFCMNAELEELFLLKSSLKHVDVLCLHHLGQTDEQLFHLFLQWPHLISFKYKMPRKFNVELVMKLIPHLPHLKSLSFYKDIKYRCSSDFHLLKKACRLRDIQLDLHLFLDTYLCVDGDVNDEFVSTSDESETEN